MTDEPGFASRWSRLKRAAREQELEDPPPEEAADAELGETVPETVETRTDAEILAELDLPDPANIAPGDDIKGFLQANVPPHLRKLALRQLWRLNPALANLDGLVDYGDDFTDAATVVENMASLYEVGRGMLRPVVEEETPAEPVASDEDPGEVEVSQASTDRDDVDEEQSGLVSQPQTDAPPTGQGPDREMSREDKDMAASQSPRSRVRMAFSFDAANSPES